MWPLSGTQQVELANGTGSNTPDQALPLRDLLSRLGDVGFLMLKSEKGTLKPDKCSLFSQSR